MSRTLDKHRLLTKYRRGLDSFGATKLGVVNSASDYGATYGPLSPADLEKLDRTLTPAEMTAVRDWREKEGDAALAAVETGGGPVAKTITVTAKGAVLERPRTWIDDLLDRPWWQLCIAAAGVVAVGAGGYMLVRGGARTHSRRKAAREWGYDPPTKPDALARAPMRKLVFG